MISKRRGLSLSLIVLIVILLFVGIIFSHRLITNKSEIIETTDANKISEFLSLHVKPRKAKLGYYPVTSSFVPGPVDYNGYAILNFDNQDMPQLGNFFVKRNQGLCFKEPGYYFFDNSEIKNSIFLNQDKISWFISSLDVFFEKNTVKCSDIYDYQNTFISQRYSGFVVRNGNTVYLLFGSK